jgi:hypothetical protein
MVFVSGGDLKLLTNSWSLVAFDISDRELKYLYRHSKSMFRRSLVSRVAKKREKTTYTCFLSVERGKESDELKSYWPIRKKISGWRLRALMIAEFETEIGSTCG